MIPETGVPEQFRNKEIYDIESPELMRAGEAEGDRVEEEMYADLPALEPHRLDRNNVTDYSEGKIKRYKIGEGIFVQRNKGEKVFNESDIGTVCGQKQADYLELDSGRNFLRDRLYEYVPETQKETTKDDQEDLGFGLFD